MAYSQHEWTNGEIVTAEKLNNMEAGIADNDTRVIAASAAATVENTTGEPSCEVTATGSVSSIGFKFAFKGIKGETGASGEAAATPILRKGDEAVQISYDNGETWSDLFPLADIKGEMGTTPLFQKTGEAIQVSLDNGESWSDLVALDDIRGEDAPTVISQEINITGNAISGTTYYSDGSTTPITGVYTAEGGDGSGGNEENPDVGDSGEVEGEPEGGGGDGGGEAEEGGTEPGGGDEVEVEPEGDGGSPDESLNEESPEEGEREPEGGAGESGGETPSEGGEEA